MRANYVLPVVVLSAVLVAGAAGAQEVIGAPKPWGLGYQPAATEIAERNHAASSAVHWVAAAITIFVTILLGYTCWRFSAKNNPTPERFSHNTTIEVAWTVVPVLILVMMAVPSLRLLYFQETTPPSALTVKAIGHQWRWEYMYEINGEEVYVDSGMAAYGYATYDDMVAGMTAEGMEDEIPPRELWLLEATAAMVVPAGQVVKVQVTASDVLHAFAMPSFGIKTDAVPGRLNETWFVAEQPGIYYGQCSELCGKDHAYMPIKIEVVEQAQFAARLEDLYNEWASVDAPRTTRLASLDNR